MPESPTVNDLGTWSVPQCPFAIEYVPRALDDIRLAVMDAFFSLPRGGAEIGGILLGSFASGRLTISDYVALDCEHAFGPSFTLSARDEGKMGELLAAARSGGLTAVGWYHSHTRSEIFLSDSDLQVHTRFFPEPWQIALVLKPHTFQPMRCGFFFRESGGNIQSASSYHEFTLDPLPVHPIPSGEIPMPAEMPRTPMNGRDTQGPTITLEADAISATSVPESLTIPPGSGSVAPEIPAAVSEETAGPQPEIAPQPPPAPAADLPVPAFGTEAPRRSSSAIKIFLVLAVTVGAAASGYETRDRWWNSIAGVFHPAAQPEPFASIGLATLDNDGQLQIHWDRFSPAIRRATGGRLSIADVGPKPQEFQLDPTRLQTGNFTYVREGESVTVTLTLDVPGGKPVHELSTFVGKLPKAHAPADNPELRKQRDAAVTDAAKLKQTLDLEVDRNRKLQKALEDARKQLNQQQRKRLGNQLPDVK